MKTLTILLMLAPIGALAASPFDGTWMMRPGSFHGSDKPYVFVVDQNEFRCENCGAPLSVKPDGQFHEVTGHGYDSIAAKLVDSRTLELTRRKDGKVLGIETFTASPDGAQLRVRVVEKSGEKPVTSHFVLKRSSDSRPEEGKHAVSGSWLITSFRETGGQPTTLKMTDDGFSWSQNGQHYEAKFDGNPVAIEGDPTHPMASVKKLSEGKVQETDTLNGKPIDETIFAVSPDGKSITVTDTDPQSGHTDSFVLDRRT